MPHNNAATKHGVMRLTRSLALDLGPRLVAGEGHPAIDRQYKPSYRTDRRDLLGPTREETAARRLSSPVLGRNLVVDVLYAVLDPGVRLN
jgi:hypothetical protein